MQTIEIELPELFEKQEEILANAARFNVLRCGRRFGKTSLSVELLINTALEGYPAAYFTPVYETLEDVWEEICEILEPLIVKKNISRHWLKLSTGGIIKGWSLSKANRARGKKYKRIIVDEAAFIEELEDKWEKVLRPTLSDYRGDAWFMSSPVEGTDFQKLDERSQKSKKWRSFHATIYDNPYISRDEIKEIQEETIPDVFNQEYKAEYVIFNGKLFATYHKSEMVVPDTLSINPYYPLILSFDFNIANSCTVEQIYQTPDGKYNWFTIDEHRREGGLPGFAKSIKDIYDELGVNYIICGDATGQGRNAETDGNASAYEQIRTVFGMTVDEVLRHVPSKNPGHYNSFVDYNHALISENVNRKINQRCEGLINDLRRVKVLSKKGDFQIDKSDDSIGHLLDCSRYVRYAMLPKVIK